MKKTATLLSLMLALPFAAIAAQPAKASAATACDRECLRGALTMYLDALARHDVGKLPLGDKVRITEHSIEKPINKVGVVRSITKFRGYRRDFLDERDRSSSRARR